MNIVFRHAYIYIYIESISDKPAKLINLNIKKQIMDLFKDWDSRYV